MSGEMTRDEILAQYRPMRRAMPRITSLAIRSCTRADTMRAAKQIGLWTAQGFVAVEDDAANEMICDIALFEPNQRGRSGFDTFCHKHGQNLDAPDRDLAVRMMITRFSLFRAVGKHEVAGVWLEDLLDDDRRLWIMDEAMEMSLRPGTIAGMRVFNAGPFHMGFGIVVLPDEETIRLCMTSQQRNGRQPFRYSLAATLYGDDLVGRQLSGPAEDQIIEALLSTLALAKPTAPNKRSRDKRKTRRH
jgi:hypothetical protein